MYVLFSRDCSIGAGIEGEKESRDVLVQILLSMDCSLGADIKSKKESREEPTERCIY